MLKSTWGVSYYNCWDEYRYRLSLFQHYRVIPPYMEVFWEYKPTSDWSFRAEIDNAVPFVFDRKQYVYAGPRNISPLVTMSIGRFNPSRGCSSGSARRSTERNCPPTQIPGSRRRAPDCRLSWR